MIRFSCPGCGAVYSVTDDKAGKKGKCPKCQTDFQIPQAEASAPAAPPPPPPKPAGGSNPFADLADDDAPKKKKPSKADLDDDYDDRPKKKPARAADDDYDDRPKKKPRRDDDEDDYDDRPKKKAPSKAELDDEDDRPKKKGRRDEEDDYDDAPKKKPARAAADDDYDDDRPRKKKGRRDDDEDDYDDRPRKKKSNGLLLTASILHIVAAAIYLPCSGLALAGAGMLGGMVGAADTVSRDSRNQARVTGNRAGADLADKAISDVSTALTLLQVTFIASVLGACVAIPAAIAGFMKKKWFVPVSLAAGGLLILSAIIFLATSVGFLPIFPTLGVLLFTLIPLALGVVGIIAATNKNVKRVLS